MGGRIEKMPTSPLEIFSSPIRRFIPSVLKDLVLRRFPPSNADESVASFFERHLGSRATREMVGGIVVGIYGGNMDQLSMKSCFPTFFDAALNHGSLIRGLLLNPSTPSQVDSLSQTLQLTVQEKAQYLQNIEKVKNNGGMFSFRDGISELVTSMAKGHGDYIDTSVKIARMTRNGKTGKLEICLDSPPSNLTSPDSRSLQFDRLIASIPSFELAPLLSDISPKASALLSDIEFANMAVVSLAFEEKGQKIIPDHLEGFGYLVPPSENRSILGVSFDSVTFPSHSSGSKLVRMAVMLGGNTTNNPNAIDVTKTSDTDLLATALKTVQEDLGISTAPCSSNVFVAHKAIPQYAVGHQDRMKAIESQLALDLPQLTLSGASYYGVSVNDCVSSGIRAAIQSLRSL
jgi:oxygen-dependent protoporphyrinogen oxidase